MRKGTHAMYAVLGFVILLIVLVVVTGIMSVLHDVYQKTEHDSKCSTQIRIHATAVKMTSDLKDPTVVCPTERIHLTFDDEPKQMIADEMVRCWDTWGRGELQLFGEKKGLYCHVCSMLYVPGEEDIVGLPSFLETQEVQDDLTYAEYLAGVTRGEKFQGQSHPEAATQSMPIGKPIGVVFYYMKGQDFLDNLRNHLFGDPYTTTVVGGVTGAYLGVAIASAVFSGGALVPAVLVLGVAGAGTGSLTGLIEALEGKEDLDILSVVVARPLSETDIRTLGCTYAPVANE